jgi:phospho-N-acetylmuramoyl-pentapeptide-transferase
MKRQRSLGLTKLQKFAGTAIVSLAFAWLVMHSGEQAGITTHISFVRPTAIALGGFFVVWAFFVLTGASNAVNLTDGLDGLAAGASILVSAAYIFISFWQFRHTCELLNGATGCYAVRGADMQDVAIVAAAMMGAATGFLWWNAAPARIFMGDTGALAIGGLFGALALVTNTVLLLVIIGGLFVLETLSVIIQVISYRGFGRRVFRMSPFHHHFELEGWPEFTVIVRFWIIAGLCSAVGIGLFYADFIARGGLG